MPRNSPFTIILGIEEKEYLETIIRKYTSPYYDILRAKVVLLATEGLPIRRVGNASICPGRSYQSAASAFSTSVWLV